MEVTKSSNVSVSEVIQMIKPQRYTNNDLFLNFVSIINTVGLSLWMKEGGDKEPVLAPIDDISNKNASYLAALQNLGITKNNFMAILDNNMFMPKIIIYRIIYRIFFSSFVKFY